MIHSTTSKKNNAHNKTHIMTNNEIRRRISMNKMMVFMNIALFFPGFLGSGQALASANTGTISNVILGGNIAYITINGSTGFPACAIHGRYVIDLNSVTGRAMYSMALASKLAGQPLTVVGSGGCSLLPNDAEDVNNTIAQ